MSLVVSVFGGGLSLALVGAFAVAAGGWFFRPRPRGGAGWLLNALLAGGASLVSALVGGAPVRVNTSGAQVARRGLLVAECAVGVVVLLLTSVRANSSPNGNSWRRLGEP